MQANLDTHLKISTKNPTNHNPNLPPEDNHTTPEKNPCKWLVFRLKEYYLDNTPPINLKTGEVNPDPMKVVPFSRKQFSKWRPYQKETIEKIIKAFDSGKKFVLLNAPTGSGKSLIGMAVASIMLFKKTIEQARDPIGVLLPLPQVAYTTQNTTLQDQIAREFDVPVIKGRAHYPCTYLRQEGDKEATAADCPFTRSSNLCPIVGSLVNDYRELLKEEGEEDLPSSIYDVSWKFICSSWNNPQKRCEYLFWREIARHSPVAVLNHHYTYGALIKNPILKKAWPKLELLIIDEAHGFPNFLVSTFSESFKLTKLMVNLKRALKDLEIAVKRLNKWASQEIEKDESAKFAKAIQSNTLDILSTIQPIKGHPLISLKSPLNDFAKITPLTEPLKEYLKEYSEKTTNMSVEVLLTAEGIRVIQEFLGEVAYIADELTIMLNTTKSLFLTISQKIERTLATSSTISSPQDWMALKSILDNLARDPIQTLDDLTKTVIHQLFDKLHNLAFYGGDPLEGMDLGSLRSIILNLKDITTAITRFLKARSLILQNAGALLKIPANKGNPYYITPQEKLPSITTVEGVEYILTMKAEWGPQGAEYSLNMKIIFPRRIFRKIWVELGRPKVLFMSATLVPELLSKELGIQREEYEYIEVPSTFPKENRPVLILAAGRATRENLRDKEFLKKYIEVMDNVLDVLKEYRGLILVTSRRDFHALKKYSRHKERFIHVWGSSDHKNQKIKEHGRKKGSIIVSPSLWEGANLNDDLSRFQIIFKTPFPDRSDFSTIVRDALDPDWYQLTTLNTIIQGVGRSVRSEEDWAITVIMDSTFWGLYRRYRNVIPSWFKEAIIPLNPHPRAVRFTTTPLGALVSTLFSVLQK